MPKLEKELFFFFFPHYRIFKIRMPFAQTVLVYALSYSVGKQAPEAEF